MGKRKADDNTEEEGAAGPPTDPNPELSAVLLYTHKKFSALKSSEPQASSSSRNDEDVEERNMEALLDSPQSSPLNLSQGGERQAVQREDAKLTAIRAAQVFKSPVSSSDALGSNTRKITFLRPTVNQANMRLLQQRLAHQQLISMQQHQQQLRHLAPALPGSAPQQLPSVPVPMQQLRGGPGQFVRARSEQLLRRQQQQQLLQAIGNGRGNVFVPNQSPQVTITAKPRGAVSAGGRPGGPQEPVRPELEIFPRPAAHPGRSMRRSLVPNQPRRNEENSDGKTISVRPLATLRPKDNIKDSTESNLSLLSEYAAKHSAKLSKSQALPSPPSSVSTSSDPSAASSNPVTASPSFDDSPFNKNVTRSRQVTLTTTCGQNPLVPRKSGGAHTQSLNYNPIVNWNQISAPAMAGQLQGNQALAVRMPDGSSKLVRLCAPPLTTPVRPILAAAPRQERKRPKPMSVDLTREFLSKIQRVPTSTANRPSREDSDPEETPPAKSAPASSVTVLPPKNMPGLAKNPVPNLVQSIGNRNIVLKPVSSVPKAVLDKIQNTRQSSVTKKGITFNSDVFERLLTNEADPKEPLNLPSKEASTTKAFVSPPLTSQFSLNNNQNEGAVSELENTRKKKRRRKNEDLVKQLADDFNDAAPPSLDEMMIKSPVKVKPGPWRFSQKLKLPKGQFQPQVRIPTSMHKNIMKQLHFKDVTDVTDFKALKEELRSPATDPCPQPTKKGTKRGRQQKRETENLPPTPSVNEHLCIGGPAVKKPAPPVKPGEEDFTPAVLLSRRKKYRCSWCTYFFESLRAIKLHDCSPKFVCIDCNPPSNWTDRSTLLDHLDSHGEAVELKCKYCKFVTYTKTHLQRHVRRDHPETLPQPTSTNQGKDTDQPVENAPTTSENILEEGQQTPVEVSEETAILSSSVEQSTYTETSIGIDEESPSKAGAMESIFDLDDDLTEPVTGEASHDVDDPDAPDLDVDRDIDSAVANATIDIDNDLMDNEMEQAHSIFDDSIASINEHQEDDEDIFTCAPCGREFNTELRLSKHAITCPKVSAAKTASQVTKTSPSPASSRPKTLLEELGIEEKKILCTKCCRTNYKENDINIHILKCRGNFDKNNRVCCPFCRSPRRYFQTFPMLKGHVAIKHSHPQARAKWKKFEREKIRREREIGDKNEDDPSSL